MFTTARHVLILRPMIVFLVIFSLVHSGRAQEQSQVKPTASSPPLIAAATAGRVRFTAPNAVAQLRLEIYNEAGQKVFDTELRGGTVVDWHLQDGAGERVAAGAYACLLTVRSLTGRLSQKLGLVTVDEKSAVVRQVDAAQLNTPQAQAVGPLEGNTALAILGENSPTAITAITHDGTDGQLSRTSGALSFRAGDFFSGTDREQMRLTAEGNLGIGTDQPEAQLDVKGMIRARQGFQFADGSVLNLAPQGKGLRVTLPSGKTAHVNFAPNAVEGTANRIPKFAPDGTSLVDSALYQDPNNSNIGIGTTTPLHPFVVRRNGATLGVHSIGELFVDRDDRTRSASLTVGTAGTLKWIFGMPFNSDGFQVYDLTNNVSRFFVDPTNGNTGIGTTTPGFKFDVAGNVRAASAFSNDIQVETSGGTNSWARFSMKTPSQRWILGTSQNFNGNQFYLFDDIFGQLRMTVQPAGGAIAFPLGNVGIGTPNPTIGKLHVVGDTGSPAIYGETTNRGVWGKSTGSSFGVYGESVSGIGMQGVSDTNIGVGGISNSNYAVAGTSTSSIGVRGQTASTSIASPGVQGISTGAGGVGVRGDGTTGVYGVSTGGVGVTGQADASGSTGVYGTSTNGYAVYANGNAGQARDKGGFVKAMIEVDGFVATSGESPIVRCYNGLTNTSTGNCGFTITGFEGVYQINFGFQVSDRFVSITPRYDSGAAAENNFGANYRFNSANNSIVEVFTFIAGDSTDTTSADFVIIIF